MKCFLLLLPALTLLLSCDRNACDLQYEFSNQTDYQINIAPVEPESIQFYPWHGDTCRIDPHAVFNTSFGFTKEVPNDMLLFIDYDSLKIIFNNRNVVIHYRDSTKGDYSRSIFNMKSYEKNGCKFTYTFTQEDFERAKAVK